MSNYEQRAVVALQRIPNLGFRAEITRAIEAIADAHELIPAGNGTSETAGVQDGGFESTTPGAIPTLAAEIERRGHEICEDADKFMKRIRADIKQLHADSKRLRGAERKAPQDRPGRPSVVDHQMVAVAETLARQGATPTQIVRVLSVQFRCSEAALWDARNRGSLDDGATLDTMLYRAMYVGRAVVPGETSKGVEPSEIPDRWEGTTE